MKANNLAYKKGELKKQEKLLLPFLKWECPREQIAKAVNLSIEKLFRTGYLKHRFDL